MSSRADALWAQAFADAAEPEAASGAWTEELEPEMARYHEGPMRKHPLAVSGQDPAGETADAGSLSASLDYGVGAAAATMVETPQAASDNAPAAPEATSPLAFSAGAGSVASAGGDYARPDAFFPDYSGFSFADIDLLNVLDIDIDLTVVMVQNVFIDIDVGDGAMLFIDSLADLMPEQSFDGGALDLAMFDLASLFGGGSAANGMLNPYAMLDSFADLGGSRLFGADVDVTNIVDIDITTDVTLIQNLVIDIDLGVGATLAFGDGIEDQLEQLGIVLDVEQAGDPGPAPGAEPEIVEFGCA